jgi:3'-5' exoribonuclease
LCEDNNNFFGRVRYKVNKSVDGKKLYLAALFHDAGKMWDYKPTNDEYTEWTSVPHKDLIHHISRSALVWNEAATASKWSEEDKDEITHCILSHHGMREWGSPVQPRTRMAWLLHLCDGISARVDDCDKHIPFSLDPIKK